MLLDTMQRASFEETSNRIVKGIDALADRLAAATLSTSGLKDLLADTQKDLAAETKAWEALTIQYAIDIQTIEAKWESRVQSERNMVSEWKENFRQVNDDKQKAERGVERLKRSLGHAMVCDFPDSVDFRCDGCNEARAALRSGEKP